MSITDELNKATVEFKEHARSILALTVAAGGKITVRDIDMMDLSKFKLVVREDLVTGHKIYEAVRT